MVVGDGSIRCNGRSEQGKEALSVCAQGLCKDAKPTKHTQTLTLRKARGIVRFWKGWCRARDSSEAIPPVVARIFSGDSTSPLTREASLVRGEGITSFYNGCGNGDVRCNGRSKLAPLRKAKGIVRFLEGLVRGEGWCGNPSGSRTNFFGRQHLTFDKGR